MQTNLGYLLKRVTLHRTPDVTEVGELDDELWAYINTEYAG